MADYDNTNRGALWQNKDKAQDTHADFTGTINVDGVEYFLNGWKRKEGASATSPALSVSVKRKDKQPTKAKADPISSGKINIVPNDDSDIPF